MDNEKYSYFKTASPDRYELLKMFARENRLHPTEAESALWHMVSGMNLGVRFRRQYIINDFIADFVCLERRFIIEVDGGYHFTTEQVGHDIYRTEILEKFGFKVIRFKNDEIIGNIKGVFDRIIEELEQINTIYKNVK